jgi:redox-sensing transcriptional repressor
VCDQLVGAGVRSILNFAPVVLQVPEEVEVRKVDLAVEMQILSFHVARRHGEAAAKATSTGVPANASPVNGVPVNGAAVNGAAVNGAAVNGHGVDGNAVNSAAALGARAVTGR